MDAGRFQSFAEMYADYFHEDWRLEDSSADDVVRCYRRFAPPSEVDRLGGELTSLLASHPSEDALKADLGPFTNYDPAEDGLSVRAWMEHLLEIVESPIG
jgi:hypothetical protein